MGTGRRGQLGAVPGMAAAQQCRRVGDAAAPGRGQHPTPAALL